MRLSDVNRSARRDAAATPSLQEARLPRSDIGTVVLHWVVAIGMIVSLATGLRISADALDAVISRAMSPILPQGEIWSVHFYAGLALFGGATAYLLYTLRAGLVARNAAKKLRGLRQPTTRKLRWGAVNVALHWVLYALVVAMTATGVAMFLGHGGWIVQVHTISALTVLAYILVHVISHFMYGGWRQLLRIVNPARLVGPRAEGRPFALSLAVAMPVVVGLPVADLATRDVLRVARVEKPPVVEALLADPAWRATRPVRIRTAQGENSSGFFESTVEVRALRSGERVYFAFTWDDPTRSLRRQPLIKRADGWHMLATRANLADVMDMYEDKFAAAFSRSDSFGGAAATHLGPRPLAGAPPSLMDRGLHYTTDGSYIEIWHWKSTRGGMHGFADHQVFGPPKAPSATDIARVTRYTAGYQGAPGKEGYLYNYANEGRDGGYSGTVKVLRLPKDHAAMTELIGPWSPDPEFSVDPKHRGWWMLESESVPYSAELDATIPVGTIIPGVIILGPPTGIRGRVAAHGEWSGGRWTMVASREAKAASEHEQDLAPGKPLYLWVAVFDHTETRHTRHARPVRIAFD